MKKIRKIQNHLQSEIDEVINKLLSECKNEYSSEGIYGYITDTKRGRAYFDGQFTVPIWAYDKQYLSHQEWEKKHGKSKKQIDNNGYFIYYVAHELSHVLKYKKHICTGHDSEFYKIFIDICPKQYQHHEINYKKTSHKFGICSK